MDTREQARKAGKQIAIVKTVLLVLLGALALSPDQTARASEERAKPHVEISSADLETINIAYKIFRKEVRDWENYTVSVDEFDAGLRVSFILPPPKQDELPTQTADGIQLVWIRGRNYEVWLDKKTLKVRQSGFGKW